MSGYIAARPITHDGISYAKGDTVPIDASVFAALEPSGCVERAPKPAADKSKT